jgi:HK97 gp10 family phage protein
MASGQVIRFDIRGLGVPELQAKLNALTAKMQKKTLRTAMKAAGKRVLEEAKAKVPIAAVASLSDKQIEQGKFPGQLHDSLKIVTSARKFRVSVRVQTDEGWFKGDAFYGGFVELGTSKMVAKPYLRPALNENKDRCIAIIRDEIRTLLDESGK